MNDELDYCYECKDYGDDYSYNVETDELESNCPDCPFNPLHFEDE